MQIRASSFKGDRPPCVVDAAHPVHVHGAYSRYANCNDQQREAIARFLCVLCGHTLSVLPNHCLPYRAIGVALVEKHFDAQAQPETAPAPLVTQKEKGCLKRAWHRFGLRVTALTVVLGQMLQRRACAPKPCWSALRRQGNLAAILRQLARPFNTSLLHDYRCLRPWPAHSG